MLLNQLSTIFSTARILRMKVSLSCKILELLTQISYPWARMHALTYDTITSLLESAIEYMTSAKCFNDPLICTHWVIPLGDS